ncbi:MAG: hypothetical protein Kow0063_22980 [Anaerolineae bacterium]
MGVDVGRLLADTQGIHQYLMQLGPERIGQFDPAMFPTIHVAADTGR